jgi:hypothetical protein
MERLIIIKYENFSHVTYYKILYVQFIKYVIYITIYNNKYTINVFKYLHMHLQTFWAE